MKKKTFLSLALLIPGLMILPACDWFGGSAQEVAPAKEYKTGAAVPATISKEVIATIDGKGIPASDLQRALDAAKKQQPMIEQMIPFLPEDQQRMLYTQLLEQLVNRILVRDYVAEKGWDKTQEYKDNVAQAHEDLDYDLASLEFQNRLLKEAQVADAEAQRYYKANSSTNRFFQQQPFMQEMGGVKALSVKAKDKAQANAILAEAKKNGDLKKAAADAGQKVQDLGIVTVQSTEPDRLAVVKILGMKTFPSLEIVESGGNVWVVQGVSKADAKFAPFEEVKDAVKEVVAAENFQKRYLEELDKFKKKHTVVVNDEFITSRIVKQAVPETAPAAPAKAEPAKKATPAKAVPAKVAPAPKKAAK
jgi:hypothetical protein